MKPLNLNRKTFSLREYRDKLSNSAAHWSTVDQPWLRPKKIPIEFSNGSKIFVETKNLEKLSNKATQLLNDSSVRRIGGHYNLGGVLVSNNIYSGKTKCILNKDVPVGNSTFNNVWFTKLSPNQIQYKPKYLTDPMRIGEFNNRNESILHSMFNGIDQNKSNKLAEINTNINNTISRQWENGMPIHDADRFATNQSISTLRRVLVPGGDQIERGMQPNFLSSLYNTRLNVHNNAIKFNEDRRKFLTGFNNFMGTNFN